MSAQIEQFPRPNPADMRHHLEHLFGGYLDGYQDGLIELAWTETLPPYRLTHGQLYGTDQIDELVAHATQLNAERYCNVYIGARLRRADTPLMGRCSAADVLVATAYYADLDEAEASSKAAERYADTPPTLIVVTGSIPHLRGQMWWRLAEPIADSARTEAALRGIAAHFHADMKIFDAPRVMRLAGSIAWGVKPGRELYELTRVYTPKVAQPAMVTAEHLERNYPPIAAPTLEVGEPAEWQRTTVTGGLVPSEKITDGREAYMAATVLACAIELVGTTGSWPGATELFQMVWPQYEPHVDIMAQGKPRGQAEVMDKCITTLRRLQSGQVRGLPTIEAVVARYQEKAKAREAEGDSRPFFDRWPKFEAPPTGLPVLSFADVLAMPPVEYLVPGIVPAHSVGILFGKSQAYKSFVALDLALRVAFGMDWHGRPCRQGKVLYVVAEGVGGMRKRLNAWQLKHGAPPAPMQIGFIPLAVQIVQPGAIDTLVAAVKASLGAACLVVIDTMARSSVGLDENDATAMGILMEACDRIKRECGCAVLGVDHTGKDEDLGIRGSYAKFASADFVLRARSDAKLTTTLVIEKQKDDELGDDIAVTLERVEWDEAAGLEIHQQSSLVPVPGNPAFHSALAEKHPNADEIQMLLREVDARWERRDPFQEAPNAINSITRHMVEAYGATKEHARWVLKELLDDTRVRLGPDGKAPWLMRDECWNKANNKVKGLRRYKEDV